MEIILFTLLLLRATTAPQCHKPRITKRTQSRVFDPIILVIVNDIAFLVEIFPLCSPAVGLETFIILFFQFMTGESVKTGGVA